MSYYMEGLFDECFWGYFCIDFVMGVVSMDSVLDCEIKEMYVLRVKVVDYSMLLCLVIIYIIVLVKDINDYSLVFE